MSSRSRIVAVTEQIKTNQTAIAQMKTKVDNLAQVTAAVADVAKGKTFLLPTGAVATGTRGPEGALPTSIAITAPPTKTTYQSGEAFAPAGMIVTASYSNGATRVVSGCTYAPVAITASGNVTVRFTEFGVTQTAVVAVTVASVQKVYSPRVADSYDYELALEPATTSKFNFLDFLLSNSFVGQSGLPSDSFYMVSLSTATGIIGTVDLTPAMDEALRSGIAAINVLFRQHIGLAGSIEALYRSEAEKSCFSKAAAHLANCAAATGASFHYSELDFTYTLSSKSGYSKAGDLHELFFNATPVL